MRWLGLIILIPTLLMGILGGTQFLAHGHGDHGVHVHHLHVPPLDTSALRSTHDALHHVAHDGHTHPTAPQPPWAHDAGATFPDHTSPRGALISLPDHDQLPARQVDLGRHLQLATPAPVAIFDVPAAPQLKHHIGSPGGRPAVGPLDLHATSAGERLLRTSRALLI
jgi:hypothetical protein